MKQTYITAVLELLQSGEKPEAVIRGLQKVLEARGHEKLMPSIIRGVTRILEAEKQSGARLIVATESAITKEADRIKDAAKQLQTEAEPSIVVDSSIVGGFILEADSQRYDASYKTALTRLYRTITK